MTRYAITTIFERMNTLQRMRNKYDNRSDELYSAGDKERSLKLDHKVDLYEREIQGMEFVLRRLGLGVWKTKEDEWVIPDDDIRRAV